MSTQTRCSLRGALLLLSALIPWPISAEGIATREQEICAGTVIVVAHVTNAFGGDCDITEAKDCRQLEDQVYLEVKVDEIIGFTKETHPFEIKERAFSPARVRELIGRTLDILATVHPAAEEPLSESQGWLLKPADGPLKNGEARKLFVGQRYFFSVQMAMLNEPHVAGAWPLSARGWIIKAIHSAQPGTCPVPLTR